MHSIRRIAAVVGVTALAGAFVAGPASADNAEAYLGSAAARGLNVKVATPAAPGVDANAVQVTLGSAFATAASDMTAKAEGIGQLVPSQLPSTKSTAAADAAAPSADGGKVCAKSETVAEIVDLGIACGAATATVQNKLPIAESSGSVLGLSVNGSTQLSVLDPVTSVVGPILSGALDQVCETLRPTTEIPCDATTTVKDLVNSVLKTKTLDVAVGESTAKVVTDAAHITSTSQASGAVIRLLPLPQVNGLPSTDPVATIEVSSAKATAVYDRAAGKTLTPTADPALVRVKFNTVLTRALGQNEIALVPGETRTILNGTPLESTISLAGTQIVTNPNGTQGAIADGVKLHLLKPLGESSPGALDGGITLELAHAEAGVAGTPAVTTSVPKIELPRTDGPAELPRTGGTPWIPAVGVGALALAAVVRRAAKAAAAAK